MHWIASRRLNTRSQKRGSLSGTQVHSSVSDHLCGTGRSVTQLDFNGVHFQPLSDLGFLCHGMHSEGSSSLPSLADRGLTFGSPGHRYPLRQGQPRCSQEALLRSARTMWHSIHSSLRRTTDHKHCFQVPRVCGCTAQLVECFLTRTRHWVFS